MKLLRTGVIFCALILQCVACWAMYGVLISALRKSPTPPNPIRVWGIVTSVSPVKISDGRAEIAVIGLTATLGDYVVVTGNWNGGVLTVSGRAEVYIPAALTVTTTSRAAITTTTGSAWSVSFAPHSFHPSRY